MTTDETQTKPDRTPPAVPARRLSILGDSATQFLAKALAAKGREENLPLTIFDADFDQLNSQILDPDSELYHSQPEFVLLYLSVERLWERFAASPLAARSGFAQHTLAEIRNWWQQLARNSKARIIHCNFIELNDAVFGHFGLKTVSSFPYQVKLLNLELMRLAGEEKNVFLLDLAGLTGQVGYQQAHDPRLFVTAKLTLALDFLPTVAGAVLEIIKAISGSFRKCLILDLDNTLWGGIIGDDGLENIQLGDLGMGHAFDALQAWARELKHRGIIICVVSKNDEDKAKRPFVDHPDMLLRLEDIAVFVANWENKADNIRYIQQVLNIGFDAMVFVDDNPFERNLVRQFLPAVTVPELPEDPALYAGYLRALNLFETASFSEEDLQRTRQYQEELARTNAQKSHTSIADYLRSLDMCAEVGPFDDFCTPRVAQLTQRSNQFNLRTVRYTEAEVDALRRRDDHVTLAFHLQDKFGDHGLIAVIILRREGGDAAFLDTWIMSCRVLKRGMEEFTLNQIVGRCRALGITRLVGEYLPTPKNGLVKNLLADMGFTNRDGRWELSLDDFAVRDSFIQVKE